MFWVRPRDGRPLIRLAKGRPQVFANSEHPTLVELPVQFVNAKAGGRTLVFANSEHPALLVSPLRLAPSVRYYSSRPVALGP